VFSTLKAGNGRLQSSDAQEREHCRKVRELIEVRAAIGRPFDLVHDHSGCFFRNAASVNVPVLATLHLPRELYPENAFRKLADNVSFNCVSRAQAKTFSDLPRMMGVVPNGIQLERFPLEIHKKEYLLWLGRICEEKGAHLALDLALRTGMEIVLAGRVYPFAYHQDYFQRDIAPRIAELGTRVRFIEQPSFTEKVSLLQYAKALLVPSLVEETSSLAAVEAAACGTPVIAFRRGGMPEVIAAGRTGFLVKDLGEMERALKHVQEIDPRACRAKAEESFSARRMFHDYERLYRRITVANSLETPLAA